MKPKKEDEKVKRKQTSEAIKDADNIRSSIEASKGMDRKPLMSEGKEDAKKQMSMRMMQQGAKDAATAKAYGLGNSPSEDFSNTPKRSPIDGAIGAGMRGFKSGGMVKSSSASSRADGCAQRGKTKGRFV
jgi:hypothetical protein